MKLIPSLLLVFAVACSNEEVAGQVDRSPSERTSASVQAAIPLGGRVTDAADIMSAEQEAALSRRLALLEKSTRHQMVVVTVNSLDGRDIADFTRDLANAWGIGRKKHNDGVVLLIAPNERKVRIAVGYGLEQALPDSLCKAVIEKDMVPRFREGDLYEGIEAGVISLIVVLRRAG